MLDQILPRLWVGNLQDAEALAKYDGKQLVQFGGVLTLCQQYPIIQKSIEHIYIPIEDELHLHKAIWSGIVFNLDKLLFNRQRIVLVHCRLGKSRSPAACVAYLVAHGWDLHGACEHVSWHHKDTAIHSETLRGLADWAFPFL